MSAQVAGFLLQQQIVDLRVWHEYDTNLIHGNLCDVCPFSVPLQFSFPEVVHAALVMELVSWTHTLDYHEKSIKTWDSFFLFRPPVRSYSQLGLFSISNADILSKKINVGCLSLFRLQISQNILLIN